MTLFPSRCTWKGHSAEKPGVSAWELRGPRQSLPGDKPSSQVAGLSSPCVRRPQQLRGTVRGHVRAAVFGDRLTGVRTQRGLPGSQQFVTYRPAGTGEGEVRKGPVRVDRLSLTGGKRIATDSLGERSSPMVT